MEHSLLLSSNWNNGVFMIVIFAIVCVSLVGIVVSFMIGGKKKNDSEPLE